MECSRFCLANKPLDLVFALASVLEVKPHKFFFEIIPAWNVDNMSPAPQPPTFLIMELLLEVVSELSELANKALL